MKMNNKTNDLLEEILKWQRLQGLKLLRDLLPELLYDEKRREVYEMTDGINSQPVIAKKVGVAGGTISNWWNIWYSYGILIKKGSRYCKIISLKELGLPIKEKEGG